MKALVGGRNYETSQFNRATAARRQPGSAFKPFVYLAAMERGLTPDTVREDAPVSHQAAGRRRTTTRDYRGADHPARCAGAVAQHRRGASSAWRSARRRWCRRRRRLGISSPLQANASIALGTSEVTPLELVERLCGLRQWRQRRHPLRDRPGEDRRRQGALPAPGWRRARPRHRPERGRDDERHDARHLRDRHRAGRRRSRAGTLAGKTGTSQDFRDAWFVGYTGSLVAGVWLGNDDGEPTKRVTGGNLPVEVWHRFMKTALAGQHPGPLPGGSGGSGRPPVRPADGEPAPRPARRAPAAPARRQRLDAAVARGPRTPRAGSSETRTAPAPVMA